MKKLLLTFLALLCFVAPVHAHECTVTDQETALKYSDLHRTLSGYYVYKAWFGMKTDYPPSPEVLDAMRVVALRLGVNVFTVLRRYYPEFKYQKRLVHAETQYIKTLMFSDEDWQQAADMLFADNSFVNMMWVKVESAYEELAQKKPLWEGCLPEGVLNPEWFSFSLR